MANQYIQIALVILAIHIPPLVAIELSPEEATAIEKGIEAGNAIAEVLKDGNFQATLKKLGSNLAPFLGVIGPLAGIALAFIPGGNLL